MLLSNGGQNCDHSPRFENQNETILVKLYTLCKIIKMGLVKTYQRYSIISQFGVIGSSKSNAILFEKIANRPIKAAEPNVPYCAATAANEDVIIWDMRKGEQVDSLD